MRYFYVELIGDGLKGYKKTSDKIVFCDYHKEIMVKRYNHLKNNHCVLAKQYPMDSDVFELERNFRKIVNGGTKVDWVLLDDGSYLAIKFTVKGNNSVYNWFKENGFEELAV